MIINIRQCIAIILLILYFSFKIFSPFFGRNVLKNQKYLYIIDAGHGYVGDDCSSAAKSVKQEDGSCFWEWEFNDGVRQCLAKKLSDAGIHYVFTNPDIKERDMPLGGSSQEKGSRVYFVNNIDSDIPCVLISIHSNAPSSDNPNYEEISGFEVYSVPSAAKSPNPYPDKKEFSDTIAHILMERIKLNFPTHKMRTKSETLFKEKHYSIISNTNCYAVLSENEFFTNPEIREMLKTFEFKDRVAQAHFEAIMILESKNRTTDI